MHLFDCLSFHLIASLRFHVTPADSWGAGWGSGGYIYIQRGGIGGAAGLCGINFAGAAAGIIPSGSTIIGGISNSLAADTRGLLTFGGVAAGTGKSRIAIALH